MLVRQVQTSDIDQVTGLYSLWRDSLVKRQEIIATIEAVKKANGAYFVAVNTRHIVGYSSYSLVPGIAGWYNLNVFVHPGWRHKGVGEALIKAIINSVHQLPEARTLLAMVEIDEQGVGHFFEKLGLNAEKYDWHYELTSLKTLPPPKFPPGLSLRHNLPDEVEHFVKLHHRCFSDTPYFQPYQPDEVRQEQKATPAFQIIFARDQSDNDVGVVWLRLEETGRYRTAIIEPLGIVPEWRRKGLGRALMLEALNRARLQGFNRSELWLQGWNDPARELYERLGYRKIGGKVSYVLHFL